MIQSFLAENNNPKVKNKNKNILGNKSFSVYLSTVAREMITFILGACRLEIHIDGKEIVAYRVTFWTVMAALCPDFAQRKHLQRAPQSGLQEKKNPLPVFFFFN